MQTGTFLLAFPTHPDIIRRIDITAQGWGPAASEGRKLLANTRVVSTPDDITGSRPADALGPHVSLSASFLRERAGEVTLAKGRTLTRQGNADRHVHIVLDGWFSIERVTDGGELQVLDFALPGDLLGLGTLMVSSAEATITALTDTRVVAFERQRFMAAVRAEEEAFAFYDRAIRAELGRARRMQEIMGHRQGAAMLAAFLNALIRRVRPVDSANAAPLRLPVPQTLVAGALGVTSVYLSRVAGELRREGILEWRSGGLEVLDPARLGTLAA